MTKLQNFSIQKKQVKLLQQWINLIEECERKIKEGKEVDFYKLKKEEAEKFYADIVCSFVENVAELSKYEFA